MMYDLIIVGAGPYGLALAAHAKEKNIRCKVIGYPMDFWKNKMPAQMFIRTKLAFTSLSDPDNYYTLQRYEQEEGLTFAYPLSRKIFTDYAQWFIAKTGITIEHDFVQKVSKEDGTFHVHTERGESYQAQQVAIAVGLTNAAYVPDVFQTLPDSFCSHTAGYTSFEQFKGKKVLVVGGGQSAWEAAALLHQENAETILSYRRPERLAPKKNTNARQQELLGKYYHMSAEEKQKVTEELDRPTVSDFLLPLVEGKVRQIPSTRINKVTLDADQNQVNVFFDNGETIAVDHIITATGYRFDPQKLTFLAPLLEELQLSDDNNTIVDECFQSSIKGLYFTGPATVYNHGYAFRFIAGVGYTAGEICKSVLNKKHS